MEKQKQYIIPVEIVRLQALASNDSARYNITGVYFDTANAVATDGHVLGFIPYRNSETKDLPIGCLAEFSKAPSIKDDGVLCFTRIGESNDYLLTPVLGQKSSGIKMTLVDDLVYPDWKHVVAPEYKEEQDYCFDMSLFARCVKVTGDDMLEFTLDRTDPLIPAKIKDRITNATFIVMPCKGGGGL